MNKLYYFLIGVLPFLRFPQAEISNGVIRAKLYLPDPEKGYYQGVRFDRSGNMPELEYKGHTYFGEWFSWYTKYSPQIHDVIMGPVEEFTALDYIDKKPGETFVKIGVGVLTKPDEKPYAFSRLYTLVNPGKWTVEKQKGSVVFVHELNDREYSYYYSKTVMLTAGKPQLVISHVLKNTGNKTIETSVYDHNFFMIDKQIIGPGTGIIFPFNISGEGQGMGELAKIDGNRIVFLRNIKAPETVFISGLTGFGNDSKDYDIRIENSTTGAGVRIRCDQPFQKINFWACQTTACPEPYIRIKVNPGEEVKWNIWYDFYTL